MVNEKVEGERVRFLLITIVGCLLISALWFIILVRPDQPFAEFYKHLMTAQGPADFFNLFDDFWRPIPVNTIPWVMYGVFGAFGTPYYFLSAAIIFAISHSMILLNARTLGLDCRSHNSVVLVVMTALFLYSPVMVAGSLSQFTFTDICFALGYVFFASSMFRFLSAGVIEKNSNIFVLGFILMALSKDFAIMGLPLFFLVVVFVEGFYLKNFGKAIVKNYLFLSLYFAYLLFLLYKPTYYHKLIFGGDYSMVSEGGGNYLSNMVEIVANMFMLPISVGNTWIYPFDLALRDFLFVSIFLSALKIFIPIASFWSPRKRLFVFNILAIVLWVLFLSLSKRLFSYYMTPLIIHLLILSYLSYSDVLSNFLKTSRLRNVFAIAVILLSLFSIERSAYAFHNLSWHAYINNYSKVFRGAMSYLSGQFERVDIAIGSEESPIKHRYLFFHNTTRDIILREYGRVDGYQFSDGELSFILSTKSKSGQCAKIEYLLHDDDSVVSYRINSIYVDQCRRDLGGQN